MFHLLVEWRDGQEQADWGMLADCLQDLNDDSLMEELRQIASEGVSEVCACTYLGIFNNFFLRSPCASKITRCRKAIL